MTPEEQKIENALNEAYKKAGDNAYFGNGFHAGAEFALEQSKPTIDRLKEITSKGHDEWDVSEIVQLVQSI